MLSLCPACAQSHDAYTPSVRCRPPIYPSPVHALPPPPSLPRRCPPPDQAPCAGGGESPGGACADCKTCLTELPGGRPTAEQVGGARSGGGRAGERMSL